MKRRKKNPSIIGKKAGTMLRIVDRFFFEEVSAAGFGLMRIAWAFTVLLFLLGSAGDIVRYYADAGTMPQDLSYLVMRSEYRFTLLQSITDPSGVIILWSIFCACLFCTMVGIWPRVMTVTSVLLLFSFHERNLQPLGGGDTVLRNIGFLLMIAPEIDAFSISRLRRQWGHWKKTGEFLQPLRTQIWPYRLLLWQLIIIYLTSWWDKLQGTMWLDGTAVEAVFHHTHFVRYAPETMNAFVWISPYASFYTLMLELSWILLLLPRSLAYVLPAWMRHHSIKRILIAGGLLFHWGIFVFMDVGSFPFAMTTAFIGLLLDEDFQSFAHAWNRRWKGTIAVLYDGGCGLCRRSIFFLKMLDHLARLTPVDFRTKKNRIRYAKDISEDDFDRAMHIRMPSGRYFSGFDAIRILSWHLPATMLFTPLLYLPGIAPLGRMIYKDIAESREKCADGRCTHKP